MPAYHSSQVLVNFYPYFSIDKSLCFLNNFERENILNLKKEAKIKLLVGSLKDKTLDNYAGRLDPGKLYMRGAQIFYHNNLYHDRYLGNNKARWRFFTTPENTISQYLNIYILIQS